NLRLVQCRFENNTTLDKFLLCLLINGVTGLLLGGLKNQLVGRRRYVEQGLSGVGGRWDQGPRSRGRNSGKHYANHECKDPSTPQCLEQSHQVWCGGAADLATGLRDIDHSCRCRGNFDLLRDVTRFVW